ncbi:phosphodiester glycosidase family protein [Niabella pedocola]|uniref:Phosphodiester glycosidase family protein n=1 Tax=Niabella pedocola TaxID=1752077 RepID=A0ABS8PMB7_9BACT|nr:phosphodiester glycosidase family protein [Niabella pedocola]MCD2422246.1 phosphodiester glycosidase family protein [Niabella pedocola]
MKTFGNWKLLLLIMGIFVSCNKDYTGKEQELEEGKGAPNISALSKTSGNIGDTLRIMGSFPNGGEVTFGVQKLDVVSATDKEIVVVVPFGTGSAFVMVNSGVFRSNKVTFTYMLPPAKEGVKIGDNYYDIDTTTIMDVGPGTKYMVLNFTDRYTTNHLKVHLTFIDAKNPRVSFKTVLARDTVLNTETVPAMAVRKTVAGTNYFAGINGDLFNNTAGNANLGRVNNTCIVDGLITNMNYATPTYAPVYFNGKTIYFDPFEFVSYVQVPDGEKVAIKNVNNSRAQDDLILFNPARGKSTQTNNFGTEMAVTPVSGGWGDYTNVKVKINTKVVYGQFGNTAIPANGAVISGHDFSAIPLNRYGVGDVLTIANYARNTATGAIAQQMVSGDLRILDNGQVLNPVATRAARTVIGASADKSVIVFCAAEGVIAGESVGISTNDLAEILKLYGVADAVHMNGGALSTMYVKGAGFNNTGLVNRPGNTTTAPNAGNALFVTSNAPTDNVVVKLIADLYAPRVKAGAAITPKFYGLNQYGHIVSSNISGVSLTEANGLGTVSGTTFTAGTTTGLTELVATYNGMTTKVTVKIVP